MDSNSIIPKLVKFYDEDKLRVEYLELNGLIEGQYKVYSVDGQIESITNYVNGTKHGEFRGYRPNGQLCEIGNYYNGVLDGKYIRYYSNGQLEYISNFINGDREECTWYDTDGNLTMWKIYSNGKLIKRIK